MFELSREVIVLHDSDGRPYFEAIEYLKKEKKIKSITYYESVVIKEFLKCTLKKNISQINCLKTFIKNFKFRLKVPMVTGKTIIMGMAPYDFRILWYQRLLKNNNLILHTSWPFWGTERYPKKYLIGDKFIINHWKNFLRQKKLKIVSVTNKVKESLLKNFEVYGHIETIPHSVNTKLFISKPHKDYDKKVMNVLFVGKFFKHKGIDILVEIIKKLNNGKFKFSIVGDGPYKYKLNEVFKMNNVKYYGFIKSKEVLASIYRKNDILLVPSVKNDKWEELFGIVLLEGMSSGLAVIASNHVGPREVIKDGYNGFLVADGNIRGFLEKINLLYINRELLKSIAINARSKAEEYDLEVISKKWLDIIER